MLRTRPERIGEIVTMDQLTNYFLYFKTYLDDLGFTQEIAAVAFLQDYYSGLCPYKNEVIPEIFQRVEIENRRKYEKMCAIYKAEYDPLVNYDRHEEEHETRTPDLTTSRAAQTAGTDSRLTQHNQTETRSDIPSAGWSETTDHSVAPYDSDTLHVSDQDVRTETGQRDIVTSYTGQPDSDVTTRTQSDNTTTTETGTDKRDRELDVVGNIGTVTAQDMALQEIDVAGRLNIFRIIEQDIAEKLLLQVWA